MTIKKHVRSNREHESFLHLTDTAEKRIEGHYKNMMLEINELDPDTASDYIQTLQDAMKHNDGTTILL